MAGRKYGRFGKDLAARRYRLLCGRRWRSGHRQARQGLRDRSGEIARHGRFPGLMQASSCRRRYFAADGWLSKVTSAHKSKGKMMGEFKLFRRSDSNAVAII